jgi:hypothetical protein
MIEVLRMSISKLFRLLALAVALAGLATAATAIHASGPADPGHVGVAFTLPIGGSEGVGLFR